MFHIHLINYKCFSLKNHRSDVQPTPGWFSTFTTGTEVTPEVKSVHTVKGTSTPSRSITQANRPKSIPRYTELRLRTPTAIMENTDYDNSNTVSLPESTTALAVRKEVK